MFETASNLAALASVRHGFFTRRGGVSAGVFGSLNCGFGSGDAPERVAANRDRVRQKLDLAAGGLLTLYQVHSADAVMVRETWAREAAPKADAMVTDRPGIALGILTADCVPVLLADPAAGVIGAAHAGWRGAVGGVVGATVAAMTARGARTNRIQAAIGPAIGRVSYEVGPEVRETFLQAAPENARFFVASGNAGHWLFDLPDYVCQQLAAAGVAAVEAMHRDTCAEPAAFFSYRRACQRGEPDYGRQISAIALA